MVTRPRTLLLTRSTLRRLATPGDYLAAMHQAFAGLARGEYQIPPVGHVEGCGGAFHIKAATRTQGARLAVVKVNGNFPANPQLHALPTIQGFIALLDAERGSVLALMDSVEVTACRTAAATALAAKLLAREGSQVLALVGCGTQALYHLDALLDVARLRTVRLFDPREAAVSLLERSVVERGLTPVRASSAQACATGADIVVTLTPSARALLRLDDIAPGAFVAGVGADNPGKSELAPDLLGGSRVVVDSLEQCATMGDLHHALDARALSVSDVHASLADLAAGTVRGRGTQEERFVFDSTGVAIQDLVAAQMLFERGCLRGDAPSIAFDDV